MTYTYNVHDILPDFLSRPRDNNRSLMFPTLRTVNNLLLVVPWITTQGLLSLIFRIKEISHTIVYICA